MIDPPVAGLAMLGTALLAYLVGWLRGRKTLPRAVAEERRRCSKLVQHHIHIHRESTPFCLALQTLLERVESGEDHPMVDP